MDGGYKDLILNYSRREYERIAGGHKDLTSSIPDGIRGCLCQKRGHKDSTSSIPAEASMDSILSGPLERMGYKEACRRLRGLYPRLSL